MNPRRVAFRVLSVVVVGALLSSGTAWAQDPPDGTAPQPAPAETTTPVSLVDGVDPLQTTTTEQIGRPPKDDYQDPLIGEGSHEETTSGANTGYRSQPKYHTPTVLKSQLAKAKSQYEAADEVYSNSVAIVRSMRQRVKDVETKLDAIDLRSKQLIEESERIRKSIAGRAIADFIIYAQGYEKAPVGSEPSVEERLQKLNMETILKIDKEEIDRHKEVIGLLDEESQRLLSGQQSYTTILSRSIDVAYQVKVDRDQAQIAYEAYKAGSAVFVKGAVFPIDGPYSKPLIDSFGFPRMPGTSDAHWHEGIDIFAPSGTPLVAAEDGVVFNVGSGRLGGMKLWIRGNSGVEWYYAHLAGFAPGLHNGQRVKAGDLVGYVGNTGNAVGTPPHLHMQAHPNGGRPINPYPLLAMISRLDQEYAAVGRERPRYISKFDG